MEEDVKIFASIVDDKTIEQVRNLANSEAYSGCRIRVMPDCHAGKGCTIGSVIEYKDKIIPNTVGVDIGCGMLVARIESSLIDPGLLDDVINKYVPSGFNVHEVPKVIGLTNGLLLSMYAKIENTDYICRSAGTLGGGNHFIELDIDEDGNYYIVIHSGSRNLGVQVCKYWQNVAISEIKHVGKEDIQNMIDNMKAEGRHKEINEWLKSINRNCVPDDMAYISGDNMEKYLHDMRLCQFFAGINRDIILEEILFGLREKGVKCKCVERFETIHNYVSIDNSIIRKGAVQANEGDILIIPINMRDGSLICRGKGNQDWLSSAPHGAGRIMSRAQAKSTISLSEFEDSMAGIHTTSVCESTIDEAPMVYKPIDAIMKDIEPTVDIVKQIVPIYNFKAK